MDLGYIFMFLGISILSSINCRTSAIGMIERIGINSSLYPRGYILCSKWIKKRFKIRKGRIPRYLYVELVISIIFALLGPINLLISLMTDCHPNIIGILVIIHASLIIMNSIYFVLMSSIYKKRATRTALSSPPTTTVDTTSPP